MSRKITIPGAVDPHVHLRSMDWAHKGTFFSETAAAVAGGYWAVLDMPNTPPATVDSPALACKRDDLRAQAVCDWGVYFGAAQENWELLPQVMTSVCGLKIYNNATTGTLLIDDQAVREKHYAAWPDEKPIAVHAEEDTVLDILALVRTYHKRTHFLHVSTAQELAYLAAAKAEGLPVTIGVCPHHLWLTENDLSTLGSLGWMKPTLKTQADQDALWAAIESGLVDVVESDHAPHTLAEKQAEKPPYGVPGLETTLPLLATAVYENRLTVERVVELVALNPRRILGLACPPETYTTIDLDVSSVIQRNTLHTQCGWSPFEGMRVYGKVTENRIRGIVVYDGENILVEPGFGRNLYD